MPTGTGMNAAHADLEPPVPLGQHTLTNGVPTERVDPYTLQTVDQLFPAPTSGLEFLALLLRLAIAKQLALADIGIADVAEISIQSIRQLARKIGWSYETTHKYVVLFCALGLLLKVRENGLVKLRFPLCRYQPPASLQKLEALIAEARPKVVSCAKRVKRRFVLLYGTPQIAAATTPTVALPHPTGQIQEAITDLRELTTLPEAAVLRERLASILAKLESTTGGFSAQKSTSAAHLESSDSRLSAKTVDSPPPVSGENGRLSAKTVDSKSSQLKDASDENGRLSAEMVDSPPAGATASGRLFSKESTISAPGETQNGRLSAKTVDSPPKMVDSGAAAVANVNVIIKTKFERFNVNVREPIEYLRTLFQEPESKRGYYYNLRKSCAQVDIWLAAAVETFVAMQRQTEPVEQPGRYFYDRVIAMHREGISEEARQLVQQYSDLSYTQLQAVVRHVSSATPTPAGGSSRGPRPRLQGPLAIELRLARDREVRGMSLTDLDDLRREIQTRIEFCAWRTQGYRQVDDTYALLVESSLRRQIWLYRRENWQARLAPLLPPTSAEKHPGGH